MEWWGTLLISLATALISGLVSGVFALHIEKRKQNRERIKMMAEAREKASEKKPRLEIINYVGFGVANKIQVLRKERPFNLLVLGIVGFDDKNGKPDFKYSDKALDEKYYDFVEYYFVNSGLTEIEDICFTSNLPRFMALFSLKDDKQLIKNHVLNYEAWVDQRYIKPGERIVIRIYYVKNMIPATILGSPELTVWLRGVNGHIWRQSLYAPAEQIEYPVMSDETEFQEARDIKKAIECFRDPRLW